MLSLVIGGSGSGKSAYAEELAVQQYVNSQRVSEAGSGAEGSAGRLFYVATMVVADEESRMRVERHRRLRADKAFVTVECATGLERMQAGRADICLLECMSNLLANEMFQEEGHIRSYADKWDAMHALSEAEACIWQPLKRLSGQAGVVVVTNEIFSDGARYDPVTEQYRWLLGRLNRLMAKEAVSVTEVVCGLPITLK